MADTAAAITVIYPVHELRGDFISPLRSWTREQTLARDRYRVLVVCGEADRGHTAAMQSLLGPNDEWLQVRGRGYGLLLNAGSARVRTPWLVMTEGHCIAEPGCLEAVMRWIEANPDGQVGNFDLIHPNDGIVSRLVPADELAADVARGRLAKLGHVSLVQMEHCGTRNSPDLDAARMQLR